MDEQNIVAGVSTVLTIATFAILFKGWLSRRIEVFGFHSTFMYGMFHFFFLSLAMMPIVGYPSQLYVPQGWGWVAMAALMPVFMLIYLYLNKVSQRWTWPERYTPKFNYPVTNNGLWAVLIALIVVSLATLLVTGVDASYADLVVMQVRAGFGAALAGVATAILCSNPRNLLLWVMMLSVTGFGLVLSTVTGADRRFPLSVMLAVVFVAYYLRLRYQNVVKLLAWSSVGLFVAFAFTLMYTNVRHQYALQEGTLENRAQQLGDLVSNYSSEFIQRNMEMIFLQDCPLISVYLIENYPYQFELLPFNGPWSFIVMPIPRSIWPDKPEGLGELVQAQINAPANLAPGIIGQGWAEMMVVGVIYYALFFGAFTGISDKLLRTRSWNPYFIIIMGSSMGNIFGLPRGGTFMFLNQWASVAFCVAFVFWLTHSFFKQFMAAGKPIDFSPPPGHHDPRGEVMTNAPVGGLLDDGYAGESARDSAYEALVDDPDYDPALAAEYSCPAHTSGPADAGAGGAGRPFDDPPAGRLTPVTRG